MPARRCLAVENVGTAFRSKDASYLAGENCTHIAQTAAVKIFLFIFSDL
jgi:hypothetical protein